MIAMVIGGKARIRRERYENELSVDYSMPGDITLIPQNQAMRWHVNGEKDVISVIFSNEKTCSILQNPYDRISQQFGNEDFVGSFSDAYLYASCNHLTNVLLSAETIDVGYIDVHLKALELYAQNYLGNGDKGVLPKIPLHSHHVIFAMQRLIQDLANEVRIEGIAKELRVCHAYLTKRFKQELDITPHHFLMLQRIKKAQELLVNTDLGIATIAEESGFSHQSHLTRNFSKIVGVSPLKFRQRSRAAIPDNAQF
ncbi:helix-turn-helix transcriptional regulator [Pseudomaricurvus alkylphenolicus]|uniref:helix-turn-helix transcriptional regulator n=1 Tax=Pseudomaricurvus alkylphenolicus TaxID=1306991 RepID=UPI00142276C1|nr:helix-turn-helix transcriptional regulator [Pseudomaricurvus alkylphenolicus]NIB44127.1 helix-turn-helix transcriptional regulator [Pseudomaricurvus alkylphenolicus]